MWAATMGPTSGTWVRDASSAGLAHVAYAQCEQETVEAGVFALLQRGDQLGGGLLRHAFQAGHLFHRE